MKGNICNIFLCGKDFRLHTFKEIIFVICNGYLLLFCYRFMQEDLMFRVHWGIKMDGVVVLYVLFQISKKNLVHYQKKSCNQIYFLLVSNTYYFNMDDWIKNFYIFPKVFFQILLSHCIYPHSIFHLFYHLHSVLFQTT